MRAAGGCSQGSIVPGNSRRLILALLVLTAAFAGSARADFTPEDHVLVLAPHPDDETLGAGGVIQSALAAKAKVKVVILTRSSVRKIGRIRENETRAALSVLGLPETDLIFLGYPDSGLLRIWRGHWRAEKITRDLENILLSFRPTRVFVTAPFDRHGDHQAAYLFLRAARLNLEGRLNDFRTGVYLVHSRRWPRPRGYLPGESLKPPADAVFRGGRWETFSLSPAQAAKKKSALDKYTSQKAYRKNFLLSFVRVNELFAELSDERLETGEAGAAAHGVEWRLKDGELWAGVRFRGAFDERGVLNLEIFGYRRDAPFAVMPKFSLRLIGKKLFVKRDFKSFFGGVLYKLEKDRVLVRIPMRFLKDPDILFVWVDALKEKPSPDFGSWRVLRVPS